MTMPANAEPLPSGEQEVATDAKREPVRPPEMDGRLVPPVYEIPPPHGTAITTAPAAVFPASELAAAEKALAPYIAAYISPELAVGLNLTLKHTIQPHGRHTLVLDLAGDNLQGHVTLLGREVSYRDALGVQVIAALRSHPALKGLLAGEHAPQLLPGGQSGNMHVCIPNLAPQQLQTALLHLAAPAQHQAPQAEATGQVAALQPGAAPVYPGQHPTQPPRDMAEAVAAEAAAAATIAAPPLPVLPAAAAANSNIVQPAQLDGVIAPSPKLAIGGAGG